MLRQSATILCIAAAAVVIAACALTPIRPDGAPPPTPPPASIIDTLGATATMSNAGGKQLASQANSAAASPKSTLSTPELIEAALVDGAITQAERILFLAYALYDAAALPPAFQSSAPWRGTDSLRTVQDAVASPQFCTYPTDVRRELQRLLSDSVQITPCP